MSNKLLLKKNKGVAIITVMITIAFISIIATTLLYISVSNYSMKVANIASKDNFYETDGVLVQSTCAIRSNVMASPSNLGGVKADPADTKVYIASKLPTAAEYDSEGKLKTAMVKGNYSLMGVAQKTYPNLTADKFSTTPDGKGVQVNVPSNYMQGKEDTIVFRSDDNSIEAYKDKDDKGNVLPSKVTRYVFKDLEVVQTASSGAKSSVKTDLVFDIYEATSPSNTAGGVGNMSMLLDSPISSEKATFKNLTMTGNAFFADYVTSSFASYDGGNCIAPGSGGLVMSNESRLNLCGSNNVVYGDVKLSGNSSLAVYGNLTVYGNISVTGNASLIIASSGQIYQPKNFILPGRSEKCKFECDGHIYPSDYTFDKKNETDKHYVGEVKEENFKKFCDTIGVKDGKILDDTGSEVEFKVSKSSPNYGLINKIFKEGAIKSNTRMFDFTNNFDSMGINVSGNLTKVTPDVCRGFKLADGKKVFDEQFGVLFIQNHGTGEKTLNSGNYADTLMISFNQGPIVLQNSCPHTTWICKSSVTCNLEHCVTLSKIGTAEFNYMTAGKGDTESTMWNNTENPFNNVKLTIDGNTYSGSFGGLFSKNCNAYVDDMFSLSLSEDAKGSTVHSSAVSYSNYNRDFYNK